jgi:hypothetical protein
MGITLICACRQWSKATDRLQAVSVYKRPVALADGATAELARALFFYL